MKSVVMVIAHEGFRDEELLDPKDVLERNGVEVKIASTEISEAKGKLGAKVNPDMFYGDIKISEIDALVFIGGPGSVIYWDDFVAHRLLRDAVDSKKIVAGICSAVVTLVRAEILKGKRATVFSGDAQELIKNGVNYTAKSVERDQNIITANGPLAARDFGNEILKALNQ